MITTTLTLADGTTITRQAKTLKLWKTRLMQQAPYGTDFQGCTFSHS